MTKNNEPHPYKKPPLWVQILLWAYGFMWLNMIFVKQPVSRLYRL